MLYFYIESIRNSLMGGNLKSYLSISNFNPSEFGAKHTEKEIAGQPDLWIETFNLFKSRHKEIKSFLDKTLSSKEINIILTGAGTSAFIGDVLEGVFQKRLKINTKAIATTDLVTHPEFYIRKDVPTLLISFARSGNSPESVQAVELANEISENIHHLVFTCNPNGDLVESVSKQNHLVIFMPPEANDQSLAMTGSFSTMLLSGLLIPRIDQLDTTEEQIKRISNYGRRILKDYLPEIQRISAEKFKRAVFLGSGIFNGIARESHLKLQELTDGKVICKHDTFLGFRHGPKAVVDEETLMVYIFSNDSYVNQYEIDLVKAMGKGRRALCSIGIMEQKVADLEFDLSVILSEDKEKVDEDLLTVPSIIPSQLLGFFKSINYGLKPDSPSDGGMITRVVQGVKIYDYNNYFLGDGNRK